MVENSSLNRKYVGFWKYSKSIDVAVKKDSSFGLYRILNYLVIIALFSLTVFIYYLLNDYVSAFWAGNILTIINIVVNALYNSLIYFFVGKENHKSKEDMQRSMMIKVFSFYFLNNNISLIYALTRGTSSLEEKNPDKTDFEIT
mgnify:CR=1 FL=1